METSGDLEEQEKVMKELFKKEMIRRIESKIEEGDHFVMSKLKKLITQEEDEEDFYS
jgi:hypothetical protein